MPRKSLPPRYLKHKGPDGKLRARTKIGGAWKSLGNYNSPESLVKFERLRSEWAASASGQRAHTAASGGATVRIVAAAFMAHAETHYRRADGTQTLEVQWYGSSIEDLVLMYGTTPAREFGPLGLKAVRQKMIDRGWERKPINSRVARIKRLFKWAASEQLVPVETFQALETVAGLSEGRSKAIEGRGDIQPVPVVVVERTLPHLKPVIQAMVQVQLLTGARPGEICGLKRDEIDQVGIEVDGIRVWVYRPEQHKMRWKGQRKVIVFGPRAQAILKPFLEGKRTLRSGEVIEVAGPYVFSPLWSRLVANERYTTVDYDCRIASACKRHGIPHWHPNQLRKTAATGIEDAFDLEQAKAVLGHASSATTKRFYAKGDERKAAKVAAQVG